jgi:hypothetical protein
MTQLGLLYLHSMAVAQEIFADVSKFILSHYNAAAQCW